MMPVKYIQFSVARAALFCPPVMDVMVSDIPSTCRGGGVHHSDNTVYGDADQFGRDLDQNCRDVDRNSRDSNDEKRSILRSFCVLICS